MAKILMKGNEAFAKAAIVAGLDAYFGYPITPQSEIPEYMSRYLAKEGRIFVQSESEVAAINMVYGAAGCGKRVLTSSSSPGIALKQEGISYIAGAELPAVIINVMRGGPGLGSIQPSQGDYKQITRGGGNGDYYTIALAPETLQEAVNLIKEAFDIADYYRNPVMIAVDGLIGQMMEPVDFDLETPKYDLKEKTWATSSNQKGREKNLINSLRLRTTDLEKHNVNLMNKYLDIRKNAQKYEVFNDQDAVFGVVAFGSVARIMRSVIEELKEEGIEVALYRPITLFPFPYKMFDDINQNIKQLLSVEMSSGQLVEDVKIHAPRHLDISYYGRVGGRIPKVKELKDVIKRMVGECNE